jgi:hypothetical protein
VLSNLLAVQIGGYFIPHCVKNSVSSLTEKEAVRRQRYCGRNVMHIPLTLTACTSDAAKIMMAE